MPAPGDQHIISSGGRNVPATPFANPFEEVKPRISEYTAQEIHTLSDKLGKQLGPEYISSRPGAGGQKVHYLAAEKCIQLANEVFGFNGWSSQIKELQVDFVDENPQTQKVSLGLSVIVRVTLRDGTYHEDIGYGHMENAKGKAAAFEKAKKEGTTDALKRALRNFGNVLGNCIYDKEYLAKITKVKPQPTKWDIENLHRHHDFVPPIKKEQVVQKGVEDRPSNGQNGANNVRLVSEDTFEDDFDIGDFDDADFNVADPNAHPDEVAIPEPAVTPYQFQGRKTAPDGMSVSQLNSPNNRGPSMAAPQGRPNGASTTNTGNTPQTPNAGLSRSASGSKLRPQQPQQSGPLQGPPQAARRLLNPSSRNAGSGPASPIRANPDPEDNEPISLPPQGAGFFSARGVKEAIGPDGNAKPDEAAPTGPPVQLTGHIAAFDPHKESPSIRKTPGVDHNSSKPLARDGKHVPSTQTPVVAPRGNVVNPQLDSGRRIGAPNIPSPMANRNMYKPPTKKPVDSRVPLVDLNANGAIGGDVVAGVKRQRISD